jgi:signal transduction histidine kinase
MMRRLEQHLIATGSPEAENASAVTQMAKAAVGYAHDLCRSLAPPALESGGLAEALRELAANAETIFKVTCKFEQTGDAVKVDPDASVHLYRIAQVAISNAIRQGGGRRVTVALDQDPTSVTVRVSDDGSGLDPNPLDGEGMGLRIMRYRARMIGASIDLRRREPPPGTIVVCRYAIAPATNLASDARA